VITADDHLTIAPDWRLLRNSCRRQPRKTTMIAAPHHVGMTFCRLTYIECRELLKNHPQTGILRFHPEEASLLQVIARSVLEPVEHVNARKLAFGDADAVADVVDIPRQHPVAVAPRSRRRVGRFVPLGTQSVNTDGLFHD